MWAQARSALRVAFQIQQRGEQKCYALASHVVGWTSSRHVLCSVDDSLAPDDSAGDEVEGEVTPGVGVKTGEDALELYALAGGTFDEVSLLVSGRVIIT